jgi:hypothetical protein
MDVAMTTPERWSAIEFFYTVAVNPIPRFFWPGKPILLADFWGNYKAEWITISFLGELVAMFGVILGLVLSIVAALLVYFMLRRASTLISAPCGVIVYFSFVLYGYMILRSLFNITGFMYLPFFSLATLWLSIELWRERQGRLETKSP